MQSLEAQRSRPEPPAVPSVRKHTVETDPGNATQGQKHPRWRAASVLRTNGAERRIPSPQFWNLPQEGHAHVGGELRIGQSPDLETVS